MKITALAIATALLLPAIAILADGAPPATQPAAAARPTVEVAFVLDTTGSMSSLIAGAKAKIWQIANQVVSGQPRPKVRMALIGYRDKGDQYVTKLSDLSDNIDQIYTDLMAYEANGGGDTPENVNLALNEAVTKLSWSTDKKTMRIIFLVGDSPPHNEYTDVPTYDKVAKAAIEKGIYINTVLCGNNADTQKVWQEIAQASEGKFMAIDQGGGVQQIATPYDKELGELNTRLSGTVVVWGDRAAQAKMATVAAATTRPDAMPGPSAVADRAEYSAKAGRSVGSGDLLDAAREGKDVKNMKDDELPDDMKKLSPEEREKFVKDRQAERDKINAQILDLSAKRGDFMKQELAKQTGALKGFDYQVIQALQKQAEKFDIKYESPTSQPEKP